MSRGGWPFALVSCVALGAITVLGWRGVLGAEAVAALIVGIISAHGIHAGMLVKTAPR